MFLAEEVVIVTAIPGIAHRVLWIMTIVLEKAFHERWETIHVRGILPDVVYGDIFVADPQLHIVRRQQLIVTHKIP